MAKRKQDEYVELELTVPPHLQEAIWHRWRYSGRGAAKKMTFEEFRDGFVLAALTERIWNQAPKSISAGTDGSIHVEIAG